MSYDPDEIRERIAECRRDLAKAEGESEAVDSEIEKALGDLRKILRCKPGKETEAIKKLRAKVEAGEAKVEALLDEVEAMRDGSE